MKDLFNIMYVKNVGFLVINFEKMIKVICMFYLFGICYYFCKF